MKPDLEKKNRISTLQWILLGTAAIGLILILLLCIYLILIYLIRPGNERERSIYDLWLLSEQNQQYTVAQTFDQLCSQLPDDIQRQHCKQETDKWIQHYQANYCSRKHPVAVSSCLKQCFENLPTVDREVWNSSTFRIFQNCYAYATQDLKINRLQKPQLGERSGRFVHDPLCDANFSVAECVRRFRADYPDATFIPVHIEHSKQAPICPPGFYKVALVLDFGSREKGKALRAQGYCSVLNTRGFDFHFYRQDATTMWSHKRGIGKVETLDAEGLAIFHPRFANRDYTYNGQIVTGDNYNVIAGYFCVKVEHCFSDKLLWLYTQTDII